MSIGDIVLSVLVAVLGFLALFAFEYWVYPPGFGGNRKTAIVNRLPFRFSLRTLLIATTLLAIIFGALAYLLEAVSKPPHDDH